MSYICLGSSRRRVRGHPPPDSRRCWSCCRPLCIRVYIYIYRERERDRYIYIYRERERDKIIYLYIYIYREREIERERDNVFGLPDGDHLNLLC